MPVEGGSDETIVLVTYKDGPGKPFITVTLWFGASQTNEQHIALQAFLFSIKRLQDVYGRK